MLLVFTLLCGGIYPAFVWAVAQLAWSDEANGSQIVRNHKVVGSELLAQKFETDKYFFSRPSASDFATVGSSASNLGPTSSVLKHAIAKRRQDLARKHDTSLELVPDELVTTSGSGLDPHISEAAAQFQLVRVAKARGYSGDQTARLKELIQRMTSKPQWGLFGEPCINVLALNLSLDQFR